MNSRLAVLGVLALTAASAFCQTVEQAKHADIVRLLRMTGAAKGATKALDMMVPSLKEAMPEVPEAVWTEFRSEVREDDMVELTATIWDKHFTHQEIRDLIHFYQTPTGQKVIRETPAIQQESLIAGQKWGNEIMARVMARLKEKGYQLPPGWGQQP